MRRTLIRPLCLVVLGAVAATISCVSAFLLYTQSSILTIYNKSGLSFEQVSVQGEGTAISFGKIADGEVLELDLGTVGDISPQLIFRGLGKEVVKDLGYITGGFPVRMEVVLRSDGRVSVSRCSRRTL